MCTVNDDEFDGEKYMEQDIPTLNTGNEICKKCKIKPATLTLRKKDLYCDDCFVVGVTHKFRATLGKSRLVRPGDKVLLAYSGKIDSSSLLYLVKNGIEESSHKKLQFQALVLYIDEDLFDTDETSDVFSTVKSQIQQYDLPFHSVQLSQVMEHDILNLDITDYPTKNVELDSQLKTLITSTSNRTAKLNLLKKLKQTLLINCAKRLECSYVLLAETATKLAANLLANVAFGGGSHMSSDIGFFDARDDKVKVLRPLKDLTSEDIVLFSKIKNITEVKKTIYHDDNPYASIQSLTKQFVNNLQINFPATIPTVLRTGDKIDNSSNANQDEDFQCALCQSVLDTQVVSCTAIEATVFSRETSNKNSCTDKMATSDEGKTCSNCSCSSSPNQLTREDVNTFMCYSCRLIVKDIINVDLLPPMLLKNIKKKKRFQDVKNSIQDFLL